MSTAPITFAASTPAPATLDDLLKVDGKAELIDGRIVRFMPSGFAPGQVALIVAMSLHRYAKQTGRGAATGDGVGFTTRPPLASGRQSFCPDAAYFTGRLPDDRMKFVEGAPDFAVEVRSEGDYGRAAEREMELKRADYFEAGTQVVWDVDPRSQVIRAYHCAAPLAPRTFGQGQVADAEPALAGWQIAVAEVFAEAAIVYGLAGTTGATTNARENATTSALNRRSQSAVSLNAVCLMLRIGRLR